MTTGRIRRVFWLSAFLCAATWAGMTVAKGSNARPEGFPERPTGFDTRPVRKMTAAERQQVRAYREAVKAWFQEHGRPGRKEAQVRAESPRKHQAGTATRKGGAAQRAVGTIVYDDGSLNSTFETDGTGVVGNQFSTANGAPLAPSSLTFVSFYMEQFTLTFTEQENPQGFTPDYNATVQIFGQLNGTTAPLLTSFFLSNLNYGFNQMTFATPIDLAGNNSFLVGIVEGGYTGFFGGDLLGLDSSTVGSQGFHGFHGYLGGMGQGPVVNLVSFQPFINPPRNGMLRVGGNILIPVELMEFDSQAGE